MSIFRRKKLNISERDPVYKVRYLGNVQTTMMKGEGCVDKPAGVLWNNHIKTGSAGLAMRLSITSCGLKAVTKQQGLTEYRANRISYCIAHPNYPRLFIWVYRHEGKKLKVELRCHAVLCRSESQAKMMALQLHERLATSLAEFVREKTRKQNTRLKVQRVNSLPLSPDGSISDNNDISGVPMRRTLLSTGKNYRGSGEKTPIAPRLGSIIEGNEPEEIVEEEEEEDEEDDDGVVLQNSRDDSDDFTGSSFEDDVNMSISPHSYHGDVFEFEIGNDVDELKQETRLHKDDDSDDDSDCFSGDESSESGFSEQDSRETASQSSAESLEEEFESMVRLPSDRSASITSSDMRASFCPAPSPRHKKLSNATKDTIELMSKQHSQKVTLQNQNNLITVAL